MPKKTQQAALFESDAEPPTPEDPAPNSRDLWRFVRYYNENVKKHSQSECVGVIRLIQRMIAKGVAVEDIALALENYAKDDFRKNGDPRYTKHIRSFFKPEVIAEWQTPRPKRQGLPEIRFTPLIIPVPVIITESELEEDDDL